MHDRIRTSQDKKPAGGKITGFWEIPEKNGEIMAMVKPIRIRPGRAKIIEKMSPIPGLSIFMTFCPEFLNRRYQIKSSDGMLYMNICNNEVETEKLKNSCLFWLPNPTEPEKNSTRYRIRGSNSAAITSPAFFILVFMIISLYITNGN